MRRDLIMFPGTLYETHVQTKNSETAIEFYKKIGLDLAHYIEERRAAFSLNLNAQREHSLSIYYSIPCMEP
jgi:hypothetical protein